MKQIPVAHVTCYSVNIYHVLATIVAKYSSQELPCHKIHPVELSTPQRSLMHTYSAIDILMVLLLN